MAVIPLSDPVRRWAMTAPGAPALIVAGNVWTYAELDRAVEARMGKRDPGGVAFIEATPHADTVVSLIHAARTESTIVPIAPGATAPPRFDGDGTFAAIATSGGRGAPRLVRLTADNVNASIEASRDRLGNDASDRWLLCLPLHHVGGLSVLWRSFAAGGSVAMHASFEPFEVAGALGSGSSSMASLVPTMLHRLLETHPGPYRGVKVVLLGGGPAPPALVGRALEAGLPVAPTYGMTETCSQVSTVVPGEAMDSLGTAGPPLEGMQVTIVGGDGRSVDVGEEGEIVVEGPMVSPGYVGEPDRVGPHRTGDLGSLDEAGRLTVVGRRDDVIITGGEKVHPERVAGILDEHPQVRAAVVVGVADAEWGQRVVAVVAGDVEGEALVSWAKQRLLAHEVPKRVVVVDEIPQVSLGKPDQLRVADLAQRE